MASLADVGVPAVWQIFYETQRLCYTGCLDDRLLIGIRVAVAHILTNRAGEQRGGLADQSYGASERLQSQFLDIVAIERYYARVRIVEPQ